MHPRTLAEVRLLEVSVGEYKIEFSAYRKEVNSVGVHAFNIMMTPHNIPDLVIVTQSSIEVPPLGYVYSCVGRGR